MIQNVLIKILQGLQSREEKIAIYVTSGACGSYEDYRFHAGLLEGMQIAGDLIAKESENVEIGKVSKQNPRKL
jgi:hypothetical protein